MFFSCGCGIYQIKNLKNNKVYIGSSKDLDERFKEHKRKLRRGKHCNSYLQNAWTACKGTDFVFELVELCLEEQLIEKEQEYIDKLQSANREHGYNICEVANKPFLTQEVKDKISNTLKGHTPWNKGIKHTEEAKANMRKPKTFENGIDPKIGAKHTDVSKAKMKRSQKEYFQTHDHPWIGRNHSDETKTKISQSRIQWYKNNIDPRAKPVKQILDGVVIAKFQSISEAIKTTGVLKVRECAYGERKSAGGYAWSF